LRLSKKSRMNREVHVRFRENARVKSPCMTRLDAINDFQNITSMKFEN